jgi:hypothetical protein
MITIWKFPIALSDEQIIEIPADSVIISAIMQIVNGWENVVLYAIVNTDKPRVKRRIRIAGTGQPNLDLFDWRFIKTVEMLEGKLVWHIFEWMKPFYDV